MSRLLQLGYLAAGILLIPAATACALYPMAWLLQGIDFSPIPLNWATTSYSAALPTGIVALVVLKKRTWHLLPALVAGLIFLVLPLNAVPTGADAVRIEQARATIDLLPDWVSNRAFVLPNTGRIAALQAALDQAQAPFQDALEEWEQLRANVLSLREMQAELEHDQLDCDGLGLDPEAHPNAHDKDACNRANSAEMARIQPLVADAVHALEVADARLQAAKKARDDAMVALKTEQETVNAQNAAADHRNAELLRKISNLPYLTVASLSFLLVLYSAGLRSVFFAALFFGTLVTCYWSVSPTAGGKVLDALFIAYPAAFCMLSACVLRLGYRCFRDNAAVVQAFGWAESARALMLSVWVWLPFPAVILGLVWFGNVVYQDIHDAAYCRGDAETACRELQLDSVLKDSDPAVDTLRVDINSTIFLQFEAFEAEALTVADGADEMARDTMKKVHDQVIAAFNRVLPENVYDQPLFPGLKPPEDCDLLLVPEVKCLIRAAILERVNSAYQGVRQRTRDKIDQKINEISADLEGAAKAATSPVKATLQGQAQEAARYVTRNVDATFLVASLISSLGLATALYAAMRAFMLVFGRVLYLGQNKTKQPFTLTHLGGSVAELATAQSYPDRFDVPDQYQPLLAKRKFSADDADERTLFGPALLMRWPFRRLANGAFALRRVTQQKAGRLISYTAQGGREFVVWTVPDGCRVAFQWKTFVAMSESMTVEKQITLRIGGLTLGTMMHAVAKSHDRDGILIQLSNGAVQLTALDPSPTARSPFRLMSWRPDAKFAIATQNSLLSIYTDGASLRPDPAAHAVMDVGENAGGKGGILTWLWAIIRP